MSLERKNRRQFAQDIQLHRVLRGVKFPQSQSEFARQKSIRERREELKYRKESE